MEKEQSEEGKETIEEVEKDEDVVDEDKSQEVLFYNKLKNIIKYYQLFVLGYRNPLSFKISN